MKKSITGLLLMVLAAACLAASIILMKIIPQVTALIPAHVWIWRFIIAGALFWIVEIFRGSKTIRRKAIPVKYLVLGLVFSIGGFLAVLALERLPSSIYILIIYVYPSLVVLYSLITGQAVPRLFWLGLPLTFVGLFLAVFNFESILSIDPVGFVITIFNTLAMAVYFILSARFFKGESSKYDGTKWMLTGGMLFCLLWVPLLGIQLPESLQSWLLMLALGVFGTFVPLLAINMGLQLVGAARGSVIITLHPVIAVLMSTIFLGEQLMFQQWVGGGLVIAAIILLQLSGDREMQPQRENT